MPWISTGRNEYVFPTLKANNALRNTTEETKEWIRELLTLRNIYEAEVSKNLTLKDRVVELEAQNRFMLSLIEKWGIGE
jgi:uncharacterized protein YpbB